MYHTHAITRAKTDIVLIVSARAFPPAQTEDTQKLPLISLKQTPAIVAAQPSECDAITHSADAAATAVPFNDNDPTTGGITGKKGKSKKPHKTSPKKLSKKQKDQTNSKQRPAEHVHFEGDTATVVFERPATPELPELPVRPGASAGDGTYDVLPLIRVDDFDGNMAPMTSFGKPTAAVAILVDVNANLAGGGDRNASVDAGGDDGGDDDEDDGIPFIDAESPRKQPPPQQHVNYHEQRFITIQPRNVGSLAMSAGRQASARRAAIASEPATTTTTSSTPATTTTAAAAAGEKMHLPAYGQHRFTYPTVPVPVPVHAIDERVWFVSARRPQVEHHFQVFAAHERRRPSAAKLCQVCHEFLTTGGGGGGADGAGDGENGGAEVVVRCLTCAFVCHEACVQVSAILCNVRDRNGFQCGL